MAEAISNSVVAAATIVLTVVATGVAFMVPTIWSISQEIGGLKVQGQEVIRRLGDVETKLDGAIRRLDDVDRRLSARDSDPATLLAQTGLRPATEFAAARIGSKFYVIPKTDGSQAEVVRLGLAREAITPSFFGYVLGEFNPDGAFISKAAKP